MTFISTFLLIVLLVIRPQEIWPVLGAFHLLDILTGLSVVGVLIDFARGRQRHPYSPQLPFLFGFIFFAYLASGLGGGRAGVALATSRVLIATVFMLAVAYGARNTPARLRAIFSLLLALALFVGAVAIHQGHQEPECLEVPPEALDGREEGESDGRNCGNRGDCIKGGRDDRDYECERIGMFKTVTVERRVRWRGQLADPNELSVFLGAVIPFIFVLSARWRKAVAIPAVVFAIGILLYGVILSQSRGGQLVVGTVFLSLFITRYGWKKGIAGGLLFALPVLLMGGREGDDADASADERLDVLYDAITAFKHHPIFGMGIDEFTQERHLTAHNAYVLAATDLGFFGFYCWTGLLYASLKIPFMVVRHPPQILDPHVRALAFALLVSSSGLSIGIFFLSFTYKQLLFVWAGLGGAIYGAVRNDDPRFIVKIGWKDLLTIFAFDVVLLIVVFFYTRLKRT